MRSVESFTRLLPFKVVNEVGFGDSHRHLVSCRSFGRSGEGAIVTSLKSYSSMQRIIFSRLKFVVDQTGQVSMLVPADCRLAFFVGLVFRVHRRVKRLIVNKRFVREVVVS